VSTAWGVRVQLIKPAAGYESWFAPLLIAIISGVIASKPILAPASRSPNATAAHLVDEKFSNEEQVLARAWEDPLLAVSEEKDTREPVVSDNVELQVPERLSADLPTHEIKSILIVLQVIPGGPGLEDEESRRQFRLASTLGLQRCKFAISNSGLIRIGVKSPYRAGLGANLAAQWFGGPEGKCALLVFIPDVLLDGRDGLGRLTRIGEQISAEISVKVNNAETRFVVIRSSSKELIDDLAWAAVTPAPAKGKWRIINTGSTVPLADIVVASTDKASGLMASRSAQTTANADSPAKPASTLPTNGKAETPASPAPLSPTERIKKAESELNVRELAARSDDVSAGKMLTEVNGWSIGRVMGSDELLKPMLIDELMMRRRQPGNHRNEVALLCESDSDYGRRFADSFSKDNSNRIEVFYFQAGLDIAPRSQQGRNAFAKHKAEAQELSRNGLAVSPTSPLGPRSVDYVFRQLASWEHELNQQGKNLSAVLIFAYDQYDKRPLIQLVRSRFPDVLILTTDLHALMTDPADFETMRNVVVASHLGLRAGGDVQQGYPPFRSCYQTALYLGVIYGVLSTADLQDADLPPIRAGMDRSVPAGRIYEIGRYGAVPLAGDYGRQDTIYYPYVELERRAPSSPALAAMFMLLLLAGAWCTRRSRFASPLWTIFVPTLTMLAMMCVVYPLRVGLWGFSSEVLMVITFGLLILGGVLFQQLRRPSFRRTALALAPFGMVAFVYLILWADSATRVAGAIIAGVGLMIYLAVAVSLDWSGSSLRAATVLSYARKKIEAVTNLCVLGGVLAPSFLIIRAVGPHLGEPWGWLDGVSAWPSEMVRLCAILVGCVSMVACYRCVTRDLYAAVSGPEVMGLAKRNRHADADGMRHLVTKLSHALNARHWTARRAVLESVISTWTRGRSEDNRVRVGSLLKSFRSRSGPPALLVRLTLLSMVVATIVVGTLIALDVPHAPIRGSWAFAVHVVIMIVLGVVLNLVVIQVLDAGNLCNRFVGLLAEGHSRWPRRIRTAAANSSGLPLQHIDSLLDVAAVARATARVNTLIYYPVIVIMISAIAWHSRIDAWPFSPTLVILYGLSAVACIAVGWAMRRGAERLRGKEIERLRSALHRIDSLDDTIAETIRNRRKPHVNLEVKFGRGTYVESIDTNGMIADTMNVLDVGHQTAIAMSEMIAKIGGASPAADGPPLRPFVRYVQNGAGVQLLDARGTALEAAQCTRIGEALLAAGLNEKRIARMERTRAVQKNRIESMITQIQGISEGSFGPWSADPVMRAVIFPLVGILSVRFTEWVSIMFRGG
jgi:hypothetical protein